MSLAIEFRQSVMSSDLEMFNHIWGIDNNKLIKSHLKEFGHKATLKDHPWVGAEGEENQSIDIFFDDGSECNIHEHDIESSLTVAESQLINR